MFLSRGWRVKEGGWFTSSPSGEGKRRNSNFEGRRCRPFSSLTEDSRRKKESLGEIHKRGKHM